MVLLQTVQGALVTQKFGPSNLGVEPGMYYVAEKAYWLPFAGASFTDDFHPGIDRGAVYGTPILAMEAGTVVFAGYKDGISGNQVEVEIRENTRFSVNHLSIVKCKVGQYVNKGDVIGNVGTSGTTTGPHTHEGVSIREKDSSGIYRTFLYNPALFQKGGKFEDDPRIKPAKKYCRIEAGSLLWWDARGYDDRSDIFAFARRESDTRPAGIYRHGKRIARLGYRFTFVRWRGGTEVGRVAIVTGFGHRLGIRDNEVEFI